ncbi:hypothetical protein BASA50_004197 [Batrachochytrium salamandrivorans]|uniref:C2H2-type domain-containing protein n=1 Tax=Batrachochytrium salamandrivorans TaxID=1357716 RepID=A0ABQ8FGD7_9FUNG|nr:hypothetical protein BASA62_009402 [Batrachochytrium salamandrivorans]KAH6568341.1 hypothetical protein BASA60_008644 [Batrachochytrium salamandrivorans]KAH6597853.1 hypothetical protein BASA50_004197 [Batrachochytrium salamandrivorans]KAH6598796.1 hypothetical protein BASA61_002782 [Batrachochytrium salamandrivorans]KAH9269372.1 hypothetical protein BASA83_008598 [Batrachochytrium salamandrivorans]
MTTQTADQCHADHKFNILILGDGNFSFSLALSRYLWHPQHPSIPPHLVHQTIAKDYLGLPLSFSESNIHLVATSFDSRQQLLAKYGDSKDILAALDDPRYKGFVDVMHGINAWDLSAHFSATVLGGFDLILWNHPHLGTEDFRLHRFLMAHFFHSVSQVLRPTSENGSTLPPSSSLSSSSKKSMHGRDKSGGQVRVSLVQGQEVRWDLVRQAQRSHLVLESIAWFDESIWPGYVVKRNKHGGSFKNEHTRRHVHTAMKSCYFTFEFGDVGIDPEIFPEVHQKVLSTLGHVSVQGLLSPDNSLGAADTHQVPDRHPDLVSHYNPEPSSIAVLGKDLLDLTLETPAGADIVDDMNSRNDPAICEVALATTTRSTVFSIRTSQSKKKGAVIQPAALSKKQLRLASVPGDLVCPHCSKRLTSARAYTQHVHMVHKLHLFGIDWEPVRAHILSCDQCPKTFAASVDLWQHRINKHTTIKPTDLPDVMESSHLVGDHPNTPSQDTTSNSISTAERKTDDVLDHDYDYVPCDICGQAVVRREWGILLHLESLKPAVGLDMCCPLCPKTFIEQRALYQHYKFCRLSDALIPVDGRTCSPTLDTSA